MKTFRFVNGFASYTDVTATSKAKAIAYYKREYSHLLKNGRLYKTAIWRV